MILKEQWICVKSQSKYFSRQVIFGIYLVRNPILCHIFLMFRLFERIILLTGILSIGCFSKGIEQEASRPNIILIMADDMGYTDIGCYGSEIKTPELDQLAENGVRFTQFYNTSRCCPTRAALLTGLYSHQAGIGLMTGDRGYESYRGDLNNQCVTLAEALGRGGYKNYMSGKWHVTKHTRPIGPKHNWPLQRGFDKFYGTIIGAGSFFDPATLCRGNTFITPENDSEYNPKVFYYTDAISDNAIKFLNEHYETEKADPFFLYVSYTSAHWPMHALEGDIKKYEGVYDDGFHSIRKERLKNSQDKGVIDSSWKMSPPAVQWEQVKHKRWDVKNMEVYAAMVDRMDQGIGNIIDVVKKNNEFENTIIVYLQDNGGCSEAFGRASNAQKLESFNYKPLGKDGLQTKIWPEMQTRDGRPVRTGPDAMPGPEDTFTAYGLGWANVSNTPFRGYKHYGLEGGISTPFIFHWPKGVPSSNKNKIVNEVAHLIDVMPTFLDAAGVSYPKHFKGEKIKAKEGLSLLPAIRGAELLRANPLGFEHHGNLALRDGRWKIVSNYQRNAPRTWELYDMEADRTELNDLASKMPDKLSQMVAQYKSWARKVGAIDWPFENKK